MPQTLQTLPTPELEDAAWMTQARPLDAFVCDAVFRFADSFYIGPDNGFTQREWEAARVPLRPPALPCRIPGRLATADLLGREDELITYYERLVAVAEAHGKAASLRNPFPCFSVNPTFISGGEALASFAWTDDVPESTAVLTALAGSANGAAGLIWDDQDQGWAIRIVAGSKTTFFVEWDAEGQPPADAGWAVDASSLACQAAEALTRLKVIHGRLMGALGHDHWSYRRANETMPGRRPAVSRWPRACGWW